MKLYDAGATLLVFFVVSTAILGMAKIGFMIAEKDEYKQGQPCEEHNSTITPCEVENAEKTDNMIVT